MGDGSICAEPAPGTLSSRRSGGLSPIPVEMRYDMLVLITYDVNTEDAAGRRRLRQIAKQCVNYGQRVQNSVFECLLDAAQCRSLQHTLCQIMAPERDSLRFYYLGKKYENKIEHFGCKQTYSPEDTLMV